MFLKICATIAGALILSACNPQQNAATPSNTPTPPIAKVVPYDVSSQGIERTDNYYWLSMEHFFESDSHPQKPLSKDYPEIHFPYIEVEQQALWGFTYKVILDFSRSK